MAIYKSKKQMHFRHHKKRKHNTLVVGEDDKKYDYFTFFKELVFV